MKEDVSEATISGRRGSNVIEAAGPAKPDLSDLGFGTRVIEQSRMRLLNRNGTFNVRRIGLSFFESLDLYHSLLTMTWWKFYCVVFAVYISSNLVFAALFMSLGNGALGGIAETSPLDVYSQEFFFSVQTFTSVGYGHIFPQSTGANILVVLVAFVGLMTFALATGLLFARFSRPTANIAFSEQAIIAPYHDGRAFEFRIANRRKSQLIDVEARVMFVRNEVVNGVTRRHFHNLSLERERVAFFPLTWTIVHPIDETSPLFGLTNSELNAADAEFAILLTAIDDIFAQVVHGRTSYKAGEILWGAKFTDPFVPSDDGILRVDLRKLNDTLKVEV